MSTAQVLIVSLSALAAIAIVTFARYRTAADRLVAEGSRARAKAEAAAARRDEEQARASAAVPTGPPEGAKIAVHVADRIVQGTRVRATGAGAAGWIVVDDAAFVTGDRTQPLGGAQWFREGPGMWIQEL